MKNVVCGSDFVGGRIEILEFVNSRTIRDYLKDIAFKCDPMQAAWLVYQNRYKTYDQKHEAWQWIIDNTPDCSMPERRYSESRPSLHSYLEELMEYRDMHKKRLLQGKKPKHMSEKDDDLLEYAFESRWYCFPTPFKRGDIVYDCRFDPHDRDFCKGTFVLDGIDNNDNENGRQNRDSSDMTAYGWFQEADGTVYSEVMPHFLPPQDHQPISSCRFFWNYSRSLFCR